MNTTLSAATGGMTVFLLILHSPKSMTVQHFAPASWQVWYQSQHLVPMLSLGLLSSSGSLVDASSLVPLPSSRNSRSMILLMPSLCMAHVAFGVAWRPRSLTLALELTSTTDGVGSVQQAMKKKVK